MLGFPRQGGRRGACDGGLDQDRPVFYSAVSGVLPDDFIASRCAKLVKVGKTFVINDTVFLRTKAGLLPQ
jgi:hypothetical protein